jgi:hypothetical protein
MIKLAKEILSWSYRQLLAYERRQLIHRRFDKLTDDTFLDRATGRR